MKSLAEMNCNKPLVNVGDFLKSQVKNTIRSQRLIDVKSCTAKELIFLLPSLSGSSSRWWFCRDTVLLKIKNIHSNVFAKIVNTLLCVF